MAKKDNLKELKAIGEELFEILMPEDPDTGEEMELDDFLKGENKKITEKGLKKTLIEACEALEEEDGEDVSKELMDFMVENEIDIPWGSDEEPDDDEDDDEDDESDEDEDDESDEDEDEDDADEIPDFSKMKIAELKAYCKENGIKGIAGKKKPELIELIESSLGDVEEPDDDDTDDTDDDEETESKYEDVSTKELKKMLKKAGHSPKAIKKMDRDEMIEHLEAADDEDEDVEDGEEEKEMSLEEVLNETNKLADLKDLVEQHDEFKNIRKKAKKIKGLHGPRELKPLMYKALGIDPPKQKRKDKKEKVERSGAKTEYVASLVKKGKYTPEEIIDMAVEKMGCSPGSVKTMINHGKHPEHNKKYKPFKGKLIRLIATFEK